MQISLMKFIRMMTRATTLRNLGFLGGTSRRVWNRGLRTALFGIAVLGSSALAQQFGPVEVIPITQFREPYYAPKEDGSGFSLAPT